MAAPALPPVDDEYRARLAARRAELARREGWHLRLSRVRLVLVLTVLLMAILPGVSAGWWYAAPILAFVAAAVAHAAVLTARDRARSAVGFYQRGLARLAHEWMGTGDTGDRYRPREHLYADDLDLFGRGSAFELLGTARTRAGQDTLAGWLLEAAPPRTICERQEAVQELRPRLDLRERLAVQGDTVAGNFDAARLRAWATAPPLLGGTRVRVVVAALAAGVVAVLIVWITQGTLTPAAGRALLGLLVVEGAIAFWFRVQVKRVVAGVEDPSDELGVLVGVLRTIEAEPAESGLLRRIRSELGGGSRPASKEIARLDRLVGVLQARRNLLFAVVAAATACTTQVAFAIEAWRARVGAHVPRWLDAVGEFEAVSALAGYAAERPESVFPEIDAAGPRFEAASLAHPLLSAAAVANDIALGGTAPHLLVLSGSNMSGKSTILRAVGLNAVLAQAGAPVRAARLRLSPLAIGASIRIQDSLLDGRSRFLAEILRLKQVVDLARARGGAVLFLLDEILGGTNSHDRLVGADAVLAGLTGLGAIGLITTHDLSLGRVAERPDVRAENVHFADAFDGGGLSFDYRLRPGVVRTSNALALMRSIGLDVASEEPREPGVG